MRGHLYGVHYGFTIVYNKVNPSAFTGYGVFGFSAIFVLEVYLAVNSIPFCGGILLTQLYTGFAFTPLSVLFALRKRGQPSCGTVSAPSARGCAT